MIPQRVKLKGFLCYKSEQEIDFDGNASLWMLSGLNGTGKSSIFDAITYALFGHHRGGGTHAQELINKDSDGLLVEFDFLLDAKTYRAKRTLKRQASGGVKGTQQIFRLERGNNGWTPLEGTGQKREFDAWIAENIGLTYDTFTSSVLLLQGKAEKLLDSKPEGRREVLAGIVDLQRYEELHKKADDRRKSLDGTLKTLKLRLAELPDVTPLEMSIADEQITLKRTEREAARAAIERLQDLLHQSQNWFDLQGRLKTARQRSQQAERLLGDAAAIEKAVERLRELRDVLPRMEEVVKHRNAMHESKRTTAELQKQQEERRDQFAKQENALKQASEKKRSTHTLIADDEARQQKLGPELRQSSVVMARLKECEHHEGDLQAIRLERTELPSDPLALVKKGRERCEALNKLVETLRVLERFSNRREDLRHAFQREAIAVQALQTVESKGKKLAVEVEQLKPQMTTAEQALKDARTQAAEMHALQRQASESLKELSQLEGAKVCKQCGQDLTPEHVEDEKRRRLKALNELDGRARDALKVQKAAETAERNLRTQLNEAQQNHQEARVEYFGHKKDLEQAKSEVMRLRGECGGIVQELPSDFQARIGQRPDGDWQTTTYPNAAELTALRAETGKVAEARHELERADKIQQNWAALQARETTVLETLQRLQADLPADRKAARQKHTDLQAEEQAVANTLVANRRTLADTEREEDRLRKLHDKSKEQLVELGGLLKQQEIVHELAEQGIAKLQKLLPANWHPFTLTAGMRDLNDWSGERGALERAETDERGKQLHQARLTFDTLRQEVARLEKQEETYPGDARQDAAVLQTQLAAARQTEKVCDAAQREAEKQRDLLETNLNQRRGLQEQILETEGELATQELLAELLGRNRLQLYLVRQAERQVVDYANAVLDRLSAGKLYLKLTGEADGEGNTGKALELEAYNRSTGEKPINVAFLSGSQKFRVAVSLALGIGQYASRQHRPIESVIIDEGFGCLDTQGRQGMIQELQNLRLQMRCILLVSHQEDFAEAFADGYHFQLEDGATRVKRFHR